MEGRSDDYLTYSHLLRRHKHDASSYSLLAVVAQSLEMGDLMTHSTHTHVL